MQSVKIQAYKYQELSETAKSKVQQWLNSDIDLFDKYQKEEYTEELAKLGYIDCDIKYSGFYSQGDGASIACSVNVVEFIKRNKLSKKYGSLLYWLKKINRKWGGPLIKRRIWGQYVHDNLLYIDTEDLVYDLESNNCSAKPLEQLEEISPMILEEVKEKSRELYKALETDYEWHYTDEYMINACDCNNYLFNEYGKPIHHLVIEETC